MAQLLGPSHTQLQAVNKSNITLERVRALTEPNAGSHIID
jgi:hypothetical protein